MSFEEFKAHFSFLTKQYKHNQKQIKVTSPPDS